ncbi:hypothetical protein VKT23_013242 [Stygiomarasmius scandens]|uniref:L-dopachrome isomerase n=1 Tax=Marasmiellus scandens TaxID=2682957 RepID=A0ABR1J4K5_9AGAR
MPALELRTNVKIPNVQEYMKEFSKLSAETLGQPEEHICVLVLHDQPMTFGGTPEPAFLLNVNSVDNVNPEANVKYSAIFFDHFKKALGIDGNRGYVRFIDPGRANIGLRGTTYEAWWGSK